jgi:hypothetical protein
MLHAIIDSLLAPHLDKAEKGNMYWLELAAGNFQQDINEESAALYYQQAFFGPPKYDASRIITLFKRRLEAVEDELWQLQTDAVSLNSTCMLQRPSAVKVDQKNVIALSVNIESWANIHYPVVRGFLLQECPIRSTLSQLQRQEAAAVETSVRGSERSNGSQQMAVAVRRCADTTAYPKRFPKCHHSRAAVAGRLLETAVSR